MFNLIHVCHGWSLSFGRRNHPVQAAVPTKLCTNIVGLIMISGWLSACSLISPIPKHNEADLERHYILIHEEGYPVSIQHGVLWDSRKAMNTVEFNKRIDQILAQIQTTTAKAVAEQEPLRLLFFVHGGLNTYRADFKRMLELLDKNSGLFAKTTYHPIFINWNSSLWDSVIDDIFLVRLGKRREILGPLTAPFMLAGRLASTAIGAPGAWLNSLDNFMEGIQSADSEGDEPAHAAGLTFLGIAVAPIRAITIPIVEAFGGGAWHIMRRRVELAVASRLLHRHVDYTDEGAARTLFLRLEEKVREAKISNPGLRIEVTLVGHSMGAMLLNRLLTLVTDLPIKRVVYLAAASRLDDFEHYVIPFGAKRETEIRWFSLARADEAAESHYLISPSGSLLVWIDNYFEPIAANGQTTFGRFRNLSEYYTGWLTPPEENGLIKFSQDAGERFQRIQGYKASMKNAKRPKEHGDFDKPYVFQTILCQLDRRAFIDQKDCTPTPTMFSR